MTDEHPADDVGAAAIETRLDELQAESDVRRAELRVIAGQLSEAISRRALLRAMATSVVDTPDRVLLVKRLGLKALRTPTDLVAKARGR